MLTVYHVKTRDRRRLQDCSHVVGFTQRSEKLVIFIIAVEKIQLFLNVKLSLVYIS